ncbi:MAG: DUF2628 domain-containing protein [Alphaproteobacteria bacterium]|nr:DUF2628 domain-containing protein [Alphaproteobacteria bacterium]
MQIYSIFEPVRGPARLDDPRSVVFLKQGFCWPALFVPLVWMLYHRLWLVTGGYVALSAAAALLGQYAGANDAPAGIIGLGFGLLVAWEANGLRRRSLERAGFREVAIVADKNLPLAEARYFAERAASLPAAQDQAAAAPARAPGLDQRRSGTGWGFAAPDALR